VSIDAVLSGAATHHVACERAESFIDRLPDGCVSLMTLDFPYYGVKDEAWDNAWPTAAAFIEWMGGVLAKCRRVLASNGSIYVFAAPQVREGLTMATRVECEVARHFAVLQRITWKKPEGSTKAEMFDKDICRAFFPASEVVVFAEQRGSDVVADNAVGYSLQCEAAKRSVFGDYLRSEMERAGVSGKDMAALFPSKTGGLTGCVSNWLLGFNCPTPEQWAAMRERLGEGFLRREYEGLRREYEALRRPFTVSAEVPYTDVWTYATVNTYPGKHPCEKPEDMARNMVRASSRPGDVVADFFCGSGAFLAAAVAEGRRAIGCDMDSHWAEQAQRRCDAVKATGRIVRTAPKPKDDRQIDLFGRRT
jgi:site-specific DNA-methyltransferase (adenine-specific)